MGLARPQHSRPRPNINTGKRYDTNNRNSLGENMITELDYIERLNIVVKHGVNISAVYLWPPLLLHLNVTVTYLQIYIIILQDS